MCTYIWNLTASTYQAIELALAEITGFCVQKAWTRALQKGRKEESEKKKERKKEKSNLAHGVIKLNSFMGPSEL